MYYSTIVLPLLAASGVLAAPHSRRTVDNEIRVALSDLGETGAQMTFTEGVQDTEMPAISGPFASVELRLGKDVQQQDLRCKALDDAGNPIVLLRGENIDITFGDGGKGAWTFRTPSMVSEVICDPTFVKISPDEIALRVILENQATEIASQTILAAGEREEQLPVGSNGPFETVELRVGALVEKQDYRCQIFDVAGYPITLHRGEKTDTTFSDADKGEWTFDYPSEVSQIICDPSFVAAAKGIP